MAPIERTTKPWLDGRRSLCENSWLNEKEFYLRVGKKKFNFFAGLLQYVEWAGSRDDIANSLSWKDFFNVFVGRELKETSALQTPGLLPNRTGD